MSEQLHDQKELLYNPKNWVFLSFFLSPVLPAIFFYRNSKLLGASKNGKRVLIGILVLMIAFLILIFIFNYYATLILLAEAITAVIIANRLAKTQLVAYEEMKKSKGLKGGRNEAPLILTFFAIWITVGLILPYLIKIYIETNYIVTKMGDKTLYLPKNKLSPTIEKVKPLDTQIATKSGIQGKVKLALPSGYSLLDKNLSAFQKSYSFKIQGAGSSFDQTSWDLTIVPVDAVKYLDATCVPGDCMRDLLIFPKEANYLADLESFKKDDEPIVTILNGQKYYAFTMPVNGDVGFNRQYITYFNDIRVIFTAWVKTESEAKKLDSFLKEVKVLSIE
ncbi:MAG: hypothetical protein ACYC44_03470 [Patescibacteria group bacterium]